ncbi:hypothetical protein [Tahibacter sp.]|uniref:hypothetical protein n=1 Tax=Tahibacter sp. TaxID=2056211 RepID=UPI0028C50F79|nr:hypothetical protein [Tahibacter sp.]
MSSRLLRVLPALLVIAGCSPAQPPVATASAVPPNAPVSCLSTLPAPALIAPAASLYTQEFAAAPLDATGLRCIASVLGNTRFASPDVYDSRYAAVQAALGDDKDLRWSTVAHGRVQLLRIAQGTAATTWLLRIDTDLAPEGRRHDLIFTTDTHGALRDQMLVGGESVQYRRNVDLRSPAQFTVLQSSDRVPQTRPDYNAAFRIDDSGRISHDANGTTAALDPAAVNSSAAADDGADSEPSESATSIEAVDGAPGDTEAVRRLLFSDSGVIEEVVQTQTLADGSLAVLAVGRNDIAGLVLYIFRPHAVSANRRTEYYVSSMTFPEPRRALGGELGAVSWKAAKDSVAIALSMRYEFPREGGSEETGEPASRTVDRQLHARLDLTSGDLQRTNE